MMKMQKMFVAGVLFSFFTVFLCQDTSAREPHACGWFTSKKWTNPREIESGIKYEKLSEHTRDCATEGKKGVCNCEVSLESRKKYHLEGEIDAKYFGLSAG